MNIHLNSEEYQLLDLLFNRSDKADLPNIFDIWQRNIPLDISEWQGNLYGEPVWRYELLKTLHVLEDKNLVKGNEFSEWRLTQLGRRVLQAFYETTMASPGRSPEKLFRIIRNTRVSQEVKQLYDYKCQICGDRIAIPPDTYYAETHHLKPLGTPHNGPDTKENLIVLCPTHHACFDHAVLAVNPITLCVEFYSAGRKLIKSTKTVVFKHRIEFLDYHYSLFLQRLHTRTF